LFFDIETGAPLIDSPGFVRALETARTAVARMPSDVLAWDPEDCRNELLQGRAALGVAFESPLVVDASATDSAFERPDGMAIGFVRLPGVRETYNPTRRTWEPVAGKGLQQVTLCGFAGLAIGASSRNSSLQTEAGWSALAKACGQSFVSGFPLRILGLCRESQLSDAEAAAGPGLEGAEAEAYANAVATSLRDSRLVAEIPVTGRSAFREALARAVGEVLAGEHTPEAGLQKAAREWRAIVEKIGAEKIRDNYRLSLGLSPLSKRN
jgi:multiple sugar transport system substrate-binding protein